jgi:cyanophycin synthetase
MLEDGIKQVDPTKPIRIIPSEKEAIQFAIENAKEGSLIVLSSDVIPEALNLVKEYKEKESNRLR